MALHHGVDQGPVRPDLVNRVKRVAFGITTTNFRNYRIRALPDAGKPNWDLLGHPHTPLKRGVP
ncbi:MAG TPA: hypothetical protein VMS74_14075 [Acidimicrobiia bacterium]|nr:hypothetical protein [Acidimicrobiia bacterium]